MSDLERAYALVHSDPEHIEAALAVARREGMEHSARIDRAMLDAARREGEEQASGEIRALRKALHEARNEALEEAAQRCDRLATDYTIPVSADNWSDGCRGCAGRIRTLKYKP